MEFSGFDWDSGNHDKCQKHGVSLAEIEGIFQRQVAILPNEAHSVEEQRFRAIGWTAKGRALHARKGDTAYEKQNPDLQQ